MIFSSLFSSSSIPPKPKDTRSSQWPALRKKWLADHPRCAACGTNKKLEVHHILPFHLFPNLELDINNLITLCEYAPHHCHFTFGHFFDWMLYNNTIVDDASKWLVKLQNASTGGGE